jgi:manganese efflux pump family protein
MVALLLVAASLGLSNFVAAISLGVAGVDGRTRLRVGLIFGVFEAGMPLIGLLIGDHVATQLGQTARWIGGTLLAGVGLYGLFGPLRIGGSRSGNPVSSGNAVSSGSSPGGGDSPRGGNSPRGGGRADAGGPAGGGPADAAGSPSVGNPVRASGSRLRLVLVGLALSLDNLVAGFALGTYQVGVLGGAVVIGAVSIVMSLAGLELGARLPGWTSRRGWAGRRGDQLGGVILVSVGIAIAIGALT